MANRKSPRKAGQGFGPTLATRSVLLAVEALGITAEKFSMVYDATIRVRKGGIRPLTPEQEKAVLTFNETRDFNMLVAVAGSVDAATKLLGRAVRLGLK